MEIQRLGLLVSVITNATLIDDAPIELFRKSLTEAFKISIHTSSRIRRGPTSTA